MYSEKGKPLKVINNFKFRFHKYLINDVERWCCTNKKCLAYLKISSEGNTVEQHLDHSHPADSVQCMVRQRVSNSVKRKAVDEPHERPQKLMRKELDQEALQVLTTTDVSYIRRNIHSARQKLYPALPNNLDKLHATLQSKNILTKIGENFLLVNDAINNIVIFSCPKNVQYLSLCEKILVDGTFYSSPKLFRQVYTVHGYRHNTYVPLVFCLLPDKSTPAYEHAMRQLQCNLPAAYYPRVVLADFEDAIYAAMLKVWPNAQLRGCHFHLSQSWYRTIQKCQLQETYSLKNEESSFLRTFFCLPFLSPVEIEDCFTDDLMAVVPNVNILPFMDYLLENYITPNSKYPPSMWSAFSSNDARTTNACESFHSKLNGMLYHPHPHIFLLLDSLLEIQDQVYIKMNSTTSHRLVYKKAEREMYLEEQMAKYSMRQVSRLEYVKAVSREFLPPTNLKK